MLIRILIALKLFLRRLKYVYDVRKAPSRALRQLRAIRGKDVIRVSFVVYDISKWKSESLYLQMLDHPRFEPIIVAVQKKDGDYIKNAQDLYSVVDYLKAKGYDYVVGEPWKTVSELTNPDIVFWGEPYQGVFDAAYEYRKNMSVLSCYVPYCFHNSTLKSTNDIEALNLYGRIFFENQRCIDDLYHKMRNHCINGVATGLPINDMFLNFAEDDVWNKQADRKVRIIWAPSHTVPGASNVYEQSTFLDIADDMLAMAEKYKDSVQWAFKPHPVLKRKLYELWGREKTDAYYHKWEVMDNGQLEEGAYISLFMNSDAMIHDSMSFMVEYMFTEKPVLFLDNGKDVSSIYNTQTKEAYDLHYHGSTIKEIESFIGNVRNGYDPLSDSRKDYKKKYLIPPHGRSASENIIDVILGEGESKTFLKET